MLTLNATIRIPAHTISTKVDDDAVLLNTKNNQYYALSEVGARFWSLLTESKTLKEAHQLLLDEYEVSPEELEKDLLELLSDLKDNNLVGIIKA